MGWPSSVGMQDLRSCASDVFPAYQLMHSWTRRVDGVEHYEIAIAVAATLKTNDSDGMAGPLEIDRWEEGLVYVRAITDGRLSEVAFDSEEERIMSLDLALGAVLVAEHLDGTVDLGTEEKCLCLDECELVLSPKRVNERTSGVPIYFLVSLIPPV